MLLDRIWEVSAGRSARRFMTLGNDREVVVVMGYPDLSVVVFDREGNVTGTLDYSGAVMSTARRGDDGFYLLLRDQEGYSFLDRSGSITSLGAQPVDVIGGHPEGLVVGRGKDISFVTVDGTTRWSHDLGPLRFATATPSGMILVTDQDRFIEVDTGGETLTEWDLPGGADHVARAVNGDIATVTFTGRRFRLFDREGNLLFETPVPSYPKETGFKAGRYPFVLMDRYVWLFDEVGNVSDFTNVPQGASWVGGDSGLGSMYLYPGKDLGVERYDFKEGSPYDAPGGPVEDQEHYYDDYAQYDQPYGYGEPSMERFDPVAPPPPPVPMGAGATFHGSGDMYPDEVPSSPTMYPDDPPTMSGPEDAYPPTPPPPMGPPQFPSNDEDTHEYPPPDHPPQEYPSQDFQHPDPVGSFYGPGMAPPMEPIHDLPAGSDEEEFDIDDDEYEYDGGVGEADFDAPPPPPPPPGGHGPSGPVPKRIAPSPITGPKPKPMGHGGPTPGPPSPPPPKDPVAASPGAKPKVKKKSTAKPGTNQSTRSAPKPKVKKKQG